MRETFYTYLGGPRTFGGSDRTVINNNFFSPMSPPFACEMPAMSPFFNYGKRGCNCNNSMSNVFALMSINQMFNGMFNFSRLQSNEGAGGASPSAGQGLAAIQNNMNTLGFTNANGYSVTQKADGSFQYTYQKDGKAYIASTLNDLLNQIKNSSDSASEQRTNSGSLEDSLVVHKPDKTEAGGDEEKVDNTDKTDDTDTSHVDDRSDSDDDTAGKASNGSHKSKFKMPNLSGQKINGKELEWKRYKNIDESSETGKYIKKEIHNGTSLDRLVKVMLPRAKGDREKYKQWVIDANPNAIKDGKVVDVNKLDLPVYKASSAKTNTNVNKACNVKYDSNGKTHYYIHDKEVNKEDYDYFRTKTSYKKDELRKDIIKYDSISGNNRLKDVNVYSETKGNITVTAYYKGNGVFGNYYQMTEYTGSAKDQTIHKNMEDIYNELMQGYDK